MPPQGDSNTIKSFVRKTKYKYIRKRQTDLFKHLYIYKKLKKKILYLRQTNKVVSISAHSCFVKFDALRCFFMWKSHASFHHSIFFFFKLIRKVNNSVFFFMIVADINVYKPLSSFRFFFLYIY